MGLNMPKILKKFGCWGGVFVFMFFLAGQGRSLEIRGPFLKEVTATSAVIFWETDEGGNSLVHYGVSSFDAVIQGEDGQYSSITQAYEHEVTISNLTPQTSYQYKVSSNGVESEEGRFKTQSENPEDSFTFAVFPDVAARSSWRRSDGKVDPEANDNDYIPEMRNKLLQANPDLVIIPGDLIEWTRVDDYRVFLEFMQPVMKNIPVYPSMGNHEASKGKEGEIGPEAYYTFMHREKNYVFTYHRNVSFISFSTGVYDVNNPPIQILRNLLKEAERTEALWKIVYFHRPQYSRSTHRHSWGPTPMTEVLDEFEVDFSFAGHHHCYERSYPCRGGRISNRLAVRRGSRRDYLHHC